jgi:hypothetical protein
LLLVQHYTYVGREGPFVASPWSRLSLSLYLSLWGPAPIGLGSTIWCTPWSQAAFRGRRAWPPSQRRCSSPPSSCGSSSPVLGQQARDKEEEQRRAAREKRGSLPARSGCQSSARRRRSSSLPTLRAPSPSSRGAASCKFNLLPTYHDDLYTTRILNNN